MKTAKIKKIITQSGIAIIYDRFGEQWLGTHRSIYALNGLPEIKPEHLPKLLDIDYDKFAELGTVETMKLDDQLEQLLTAAEQNSPELEPMTIAEAELSIFGTELAILQAGRRMLFLQKTELAPISFTPQTRFLLGKAFNREWVVAMDGLFPIALLCGRRFTQDAATLVNEIAAAAVSNMEEPHDY